MFEEDDDDWPPPEARVRAAVWRAEGHFERREYFAASAALAPVFGRAGEDEELVRGLHHLAAAGYRHQTGEDERARRQLEHARRRLGSYPDVMPLVRLVEQDVGP
ncbi:MAG TPA: hypothetical protein VIZ44_00220 [Gaiellaceae bacterium]